jgi:hypothetical protein
MIGSEAITARGAQFADPLPEYRHAPLLRCSHTRQQAQQGAFSAPAGALDKQPLARFDPQVVDRQIGFVTAGPTETDRLKDD